MDIVEKKTRKPLTFGDLQYGEAFRHQAGGLYMKIHKHTTTNCVTLSGGVRGWCHDGDPVERVSGAFVEGYTEEAP